VEAACRLAIDRSSLIDVRLAAAERVLAEGRYGEVPERRAVLDLVDELDEVAWDIQARVEAGTALEADYLRAFERARAAAALGFAFEVDSRVAGRQALYEAYHAIHDPDSLRDVVTAAIG